jgi:hypothetical protein
MMTLAMIEGAKTKRTAERGREAPLVISPGAVARLVKGMFATMRKRSAGR